MNPTRDDAIETLLREQFDGALRDEGFSERVMQRLPRRRHRASWPLWSGLVAGVVASWLALLSSPLLHLGWQDWVGGRRSVANLVLLSAVVTMILLASVWSVTEADDR